MSLSRHSSIQLPGQQSGAVLLAFTLVVVVGASFLLVNQLNAKINSNVRTEQSIENLLIAKQALIAYAVAYPDMLYSDDARKGPGLLPCPDRHTEFNTDFGKSGSDGQAGGACGSSGQTSIGRFPGKQDNMNVGTLKDNAGEYLWYVLSDNFRTSLNFKHGHYVNSETEGQITLNGKDDIVAVIISPGEPLNGQVRNADNFNDVTHYLEGVNADLGTDYYTFQSGIIKDTNGDVISNDIIIPLTRRELMSYVEKRVLNEVSSAINRYRGYNRVDFDGDNNFDDNGDGFVDIENMNFDYAFPWLSQYRNPATANPILTGTTTSTGLANQLVDSSRNFINDGITVGDLVQNLTDDTVGIVADVSSDDTLLISPLAAGLNDVVFNVGDAYQIPGFNSASTTTQGHLPYHEDNEAFISSFDLDWRFTDSTDTPIITSDNPLADLEHEATLVTSIFGGQTHHVAFTEDQSACIWLNDVNAVRCIGVNVELDFLSGTATSNTTTNNQIITLEDSNRNFYAAGVRKGDILQNLSQISELSVLQSQATAGSGENLLVDTSLVDNFNDLLIEPYYFLVEKTGIDVNGDPVIETAVISDVQANQLSLLESDQTSMTINPGDNYTIRPVVQGIVSSISSADPDQLEAIEISGTGNAQLSFEPDDKYRIRVASSSLVGLSTFVFTFNNGSSNSYMVFDATADLSNVKVGDIVESDSGGLAVITQIGPWSTFAYWFVHSELVGGSSPRVGNGENYQIHQNHIDKREFIADVTLTGTNYDIYSTESNADNGLRVREVCRGYIADNGDECASLSLATELNENIELTVNEYNADDELLVTSSLSKPQGIDLTGNMKISNVRLDLIKDAGSLAGSDIPVWFIHNQWHHHVYVAYTDDLSASENDGCSQNPVDDSFLNCLSINTSTLSNGDIYTTQQNGINSLVVLAGQSLDSPVLTQERNPLNNDLDPPGMDDYFEAENFDEDNVFELFQKSDNYNDRILVLDRFRNE